MSAKLSEFGQLIQSARGGVLAEEIDEKLKSQVDFWTVPSGARCREVLSDGDHTHRS